MKFVSLLLLFFLFFLPAPAIAERSLTFGLWTQHYAGDHTEGVNNHLYGLEYDGFVFSFFKNSYGNETVFLAKAWHTKKLRKSKLWLRGNLYAGALIGYGEHHPVRWRAVSPGLYPTLSVGRDQYSLELGVMPTFWWLGFKVEF